MRRCFCMVATVVRPRLGKHCFHPFDPEPAILRKSPWNWGQKVMLKETLEWNLPNLEFLLLNPSASVPSMSTSRSLNWLINRGFPETCHLPWAYRPAIKFADLPFRLLRLSWTCNGPFKWGHWLHLEAIKVEGVVTLIVVNLWARLYRGNKHTSRSENKCQVPRNEPWRWGRTCRSLCITLPDEIGRDPICVCTSASRVCTNTQAQCQQIQITCLFKSDPSPIRSKSKSNSNPNLNPIQIQAKVQFKSKPKSNSNLITIQSKSNRIQVQLQSQPNSKSKSKPSRIQSNSNPNPFAISIQFQSQSKSNPSRIQSNSFGISIYFF